MIYNNIRYVILFLSVLGLSGSCEEKNKEEIKTIEPGVYKGQFMRASPIAKYAPSNVTIEFTFNQFSGQSDMTNFPAICSGTFSIVANEINFENECFFTADFDWSLILKGTCQFKVSGSLLEMTRVHGEITDKYTLRLQ